MFEGDFKLNYHLAPPIIAKKNAKGELQKQKFGPAMLTGFRLLAKLKGLRGTALDVFGRTEERKTERALIGEYRASIDEVLAGLNADNHAMALEIASLPEQIRGYGHVKERNLAAARTRWAELMAKWRDPRRAQRVAPPEGRLAAGRADARRLAAPDSAGGRRPRHTMPGAVRGQAPRCAAAAGACALDAEPRARPARSYPSLCWRLPCSFPLLSPRPRPLLPAAAT